MQTARKYSQWMAATENTVLRWGSFPDPGPFSPHPGIPDKFVDFQCWCSAWRFSSEQDRGGPAHFLEETQPETNIHIVLRCRTIILASWEAEAGESQIQNWPGKHRPYLKIKSRRRARDVAQRWDCLFSISEVLGSIHSTAKKKKKKRLKILGYAMQCQVMWSLITCKLTSEIGLCQLKDKLTLSQAFPAHSQLALFETASS